MEKFKAFQCPHCIFLSGIVIKTSAAYYYAEGYKATYPRDTYMLSACGHELNKMPEVVEVEDGKIKNDKDSK